MDVQQLVERKLADELKYLKKTYLNATLSSVIPTLPDLGLRPGCLSGKPVTNRLNYDSLNPPCGIMVTEPKLG
jgi:hypothetical protein